MPKKLTLEDCMNVASQKKGACLSREYVNSSTKLTWQCHEGHIWDAKVSDVKSGYWCPYCAGVAKPTIESLKELAASRGGKCLSPEYVNNREKILWECAKGHQFEMNFKAVKQQNQWCTICSGKYRLFTRQELDEIAVSKGGRFTSTLEKFLISDRGDWVCANGHHWSAKIANIISNNSWCPQCNNNLGEKICRFIFQEMTGKKFPQKRPVWLRDSSQSKSMELDGYCEELKIAFEHQGKQHYSQDGSSFFDSGVMERDEIKRMICSKKGVDVLEIPQIGHFISLNEAVSLIRDFLIKHQVEIIKSISADDVDKNLSNVYDKKIDELKEIAKLKGGLCLAETYLGHVTPLKFRCSVGHEWLARPNDIKRGSWCSICSGAGGKKKTLEDLINMFKDDGVTCISDKYLGSKASYKWQCKNKHTFDSRYDSLQKKVNKCPLC